MEKYRTKIGQFMYDITDKICSKIMKHKWLIYLLNYTWGILTTIAGWIVYLFLKVFKRKEIITDTFMHCHRVEYGEYWGGVSLGMVIITSKEPFLSTLWHEAGHSIQNALYGPFFLFLIAIPSCIRYWYRNYYVETHKSEPDYFMKPYDAAWFESSASDLGNKYFNNYRK